MHLMKNYSKRLLGTIPMEEEDNLPTIPHQMGVLVGHEMKSHGSHKGEFWARNCEKDEAYGYNRS